MLKLVVCPDGNYFESKTLNNIFLGYIFRQVHLKSKGIHAKMAANTYNEIVLPLINEKDSLIVINWFKHKDYWQVQ